MTNKPELDDEIDEAIQTQETDDGVDDLEARKASLAAEHKEVLAALVAEEVKSLKASLDKAFKVRDETQKENLKLKQTQKELETKRLKDEGKHLEVATLRIAELEEREKTLEARLIAVERDRELERVLAPLDFQSDFARDAAVSSIKSELVQDEDGTWVHRSGASLSEYVKAFTKDPQKAFLFKPKNNQGPGVDPNKHQGSKGRPAKLTGLSTEELLKQASQGNLGKFTL